VINGAKSVHTLPVLIYDFLLKTRKNSIKTSLKTKFWTVRSSRVYDVIKTPFLAGKVKLVRLEKYSDNSISEQESYIRFDVGHFFLFITVVEHKFFKISRHCNICLTFLWHTIRSVCLTKVGSFEIKKWRNVSKLNTFRDDTISYLLLRNYL